MTVTSAMEFVVSHLSKVGRSNCLPSYAQYCNLHHELLKVEQCTVCSSSSVGGRCVQEAVFM